MLALSRDDRETWAVKWKLTEEPEFSELSVGEERVIVAKVRWYPWGDKSITVDTLLVPPTSRFPDWHVRVHCIKANPESLVNRLHVVEGGFAIHDRYRVSSYSVTRPVQSGAIF
jgi:hypothetical protein